MTKLIVTAWRWTYEDAQSSDFRSKRAAVDDLSKRFDMSVRYAEFFVYSVVIPIPDEWEGHARTT